MVTTNNRTDRSSLMLVDTKEHLMSDAQLLDGLIEVVHGNAEALPMLALHLVDQAAAERLATARGFQVNREAIVQVLQALKERRITPDMAQQWASFIRRGFIAGHTSVPASPIFIEYDPLFEDDIVPAIGRLDELGDVIDGELSDDEIDTLIEQPSRAGQ